MTTLHPRIPSSFGGGNDANKFRHLRAEAIQHILATATQSANFSSQNRDGGNGIIISYGRCLKLNDGDLVHRQYKKEQLEEALTRGRVPDILKPKINVETYNEAIDTIHTDMKTYVKILNGKVNATEQMPQLTEDQAAAWVENICQQRKDNGSIDESVSAIPRKIAPFLPKYRTKQETIVALKKKFPDKTFRQLSRQVFFGSDLFKLADTLFVNEDFQYIMDLKSIKKGHYHPDVKDLYLDIIIRILALLRQCQTIREMQKLGTCPNAELQYYENAKKFDRENSDNRAAVYLRERQEEFEFIMVVLRNVFSKAWTGQIELHMLDVMCIVMMRLRKTHKSTNNYTEKKMPKLVFVLKRLFQSGKLNINQGISFQEKFCDLLYLELKKVLDEPRLFKLNKEERNMKYNEQNGKCPFCGEQIAKERLMDGSYIHQDHIIPYAKGGPTTLDNCQLLHGVCNKRKSDKISPKSLC